MATIDFQGTRQLLQYLCKVSEHFVEMIGTTTIYFQGFMNRLLF